MADDASPPLEAPALSLPKGGGALRGIGERFDVNPASGTASFQVPLNLSAGRFGPELSLAYDSGHGNGPFGFGWRLSPPAISRGVNQGVPRYTDDDVYLLAGADELIAVGAATQRLDHRVERFRPCIERDYARIERWTRLADGDVHWRMLSNSNVLTVFGLDERSRVCDPGDPRRVFSWLLSHSYDDKGNAIVYEYAAEDATHVDVTASAERSRTRGAVRYLKRIRYGNRRPLLIDPAAPSLRAAHVPAPDVDGADWMFEVVLDYGEDHYREQDADGRVVAQADAEGAGDWPVRSDSFSSYRAGFEQRMHRLCRRVLMFHRFPELGTAACLVRATELGYAETTAGAFLTTVEERGYRALASGHYLRRARPALALEYTTSPLDDPDYRGAGVVELDQQSAENLHVADDAQRLWVDLDGHGVPGVLSRDGGAWFYKPNTGDGRLGPARTLELQAPHADAPAHQPVDLTGDGTLDMVALAEPAPGYARRVDGRFTPLRPFESFPQVDWQQTRLVDLVGDGLADLLVADGDALRWHRSLGTAGFAHASQIELARDVAPSRPLRICNPMDAVLFADMTGDGLSDMVWVRAGEVSYRPNLGHGRFGALVVMENAPLFEPDGRFDAERVLLADTDGSGTADLIYLGADAVRVYLNRCGNGWSSPRVLSAAPPAPGATSAAVSDLLGRGTACLIWSSSLSVDARRPVRYLDLAGGQKPHLLVGMKNNLGAETRVSYAPSTRFFLHDERAGTPWTSRLPFPLHVVERVETLDHVGRNRYVRRYSYHHGHFDARTREFRGFGRVDQYDTEELGALSGTTQLPDAQNVDAASYVPPVRTRRWFRTGAPATLDHEYAGPPLTRVELPVGLTPDGLARAGEALMGIPLRTETCALDGSPEQERPRVIRESGQRVVELEAGVFHAREIESVELEVDPSAPDDPRVAHHVHLDVDAFGNTLLAASVAYGRAPGAPADPLLEPDDVRRQRRTYVTYAVARHTNPVTLDDAHRAPALAERTTYELLHGAPAAERFTAAELIALIGAVAGGDRDLPYDDFEGALAVEPGPHRRLTGRVRMLYRADELTRTLPLGELEPLGLPAVTHTLALTPALATSLYVAGAKLAPEELDAALRGYVHSEGDPGWWVPSEQATFAADASAELESAIRGFFRPRCFTDALGERTLVEYDAHALLPTARVDAVGNRVEVVNDYRVLEPVVSIDPNGNRSEVVFDAFGEVAGTAVTGGPTGDSLEGFDPDLPEAVVDAHLADPFAAPDALLGRATTRRIVSYAGASAAVLTLARAADTAIEQRIVYSDGFGHEVQVKQAEAPGRWRTEGWTILDNKGQPVRRFEPFVDDTPAFRFAPTTGVSAIVFRDALGRVAAIAHPHRAWEKRVEGPWRAETWDVNDTVLLDPADDADAGPYFRRLPDDVYLPTWYAQRAEGALGPVEQRAAHAAAAHAATPKVEFRDALGRVFLTVAHNRAAATDEHHRRTELSDCTGCVRRQIDELGRECARYGYDLMGNRVSTMSMDNGTRRMLLDARGSQIRAWDARGHVFTTTHDGLRRVVTRSVRGTDRERSDPRTLDRDVVYERLQYGEELADATDANLRTRLVRVCDGAGVLTTDSFDVRGNCLRRTHQLVASFEALPDWSAAPELDPEAYVGEAAYDAMGRLTQMRSPDGSVITPSYDGLGRLATLDVRLPGASDDTRFVEGVTYDAHDNRTQIRFGNGTRTDYAYDRETFRLIRQVTSRRPVTDERSALFASPTILQDIRHTYDPLGNLLESTDRAQRTVLANGQAIDANVVNLYDAVYRLIETHGREQGQLGDVGSLRRCGERYEHDVAGNLTRIVHRAANGGSWQRAFGYAAPSELEPRTASNQLSHVAGDDPSHFTYDAHGCVTSMSHLTLMRWDFKDQLGATARQAGEDPETTVYAYDALGTRRRKVTTRRNGTRRSERLYLGELEVYREFGPDGTTVTARRDCLSILDEQRRIALVELADGGAPAVRYQLGDHLDSATIELDGSGAVITYEEFAAFGSTRVSGGRSVAETGLKRYRFTGKERDRETGLSYHGARYYAPWLARWISCDPEALATPRDGTATPDGPRSPSWNPYLYARGNPHAYTDPTGRLDVYGRIGIAAGVTLAPIALLLGTGLVLDAAKVPVPGAAPGENARWVASEEGALGDWWVIGHYATPALFTLAVAIPMTILGADPNLTFILAGMAGAAEAIIWEAIERNVVAAMHQNARRGGIFKGWKEGTKVAALEFRSNTLFEDIVLGSIAAFSWAYLVPFLVGRAPDTSLTLSFGIYMQIWMLGAGWGLVYGGHIPTHDTHIYDPDRDEFRRRPASSPLTPSPSPTPGP